MGDNRVLFGATLVCAWVTKLGVNLTNLGIDFTFLRLYNLSRIV